MSNSKISALTAATTPLAGTEVLPIVQSGATKQVSVANLTAGRSVSAASLSLTTTPLATTSGGTGLTSFTANGVVYASSTSALATSGNITWNGSKLGLSTNASAGTNNVLVDLSDGTYPNSGFPTIKFNGFGGGNGYSAAMYGTQYGAIVIATADTFGGTYTSSMTFANGGTGDVTVHKGNLLIATSGNGLTSTGTITCKSSSGGANWQVFSSASSTNPSHFVNGSGTVNGIGTGASGAASAMYVNRDTGTLRSINAAGSLNASGADYAEYMVKDGDFVIAKGDICGIKANGKLTNVFADSISFVVKSTDPSYVGGDTWFNEQSPQISIEPVKPVKPIVLVESENTTNEQKIQYQQDLTEYQTALAQYELDLAQHESSMESYDADLASWKQRLEAARLPVDRIAFCGQVPVNVQGATPGQFIIPVDDNGAIKGQAISNPTFEQYQSAIGKVIAIEADGRAKIIVKIS